MYLQLLIKYLEKVEFKRDRGEKTRSRWTLDYTNCRIVHQETIGI